MLLSGKRGLDALLAEYGASKNGLPAIAGCYAGGNLVVCGDAAGVWDDLAAFGCRSDSGKGSVAKDGWDFLVINKLGETFPGAIEHWYSNAGPSIQKWKAARRDEYSGEFPAPKHTHTCNTGAMWLWPWGAHGTSGLGAVFVSLGLGYSHIVLCGMPLDDGPHNGEPPWRRTKFTVEVRNEADGGPETHWRRARDKAFGDRVKSMSGRTREWLGAP